MSPFPEQDHTRLLQAVLDKWLQLWGRHQRKIERLQRKITASQRGYIPLIHGGGASMSMRDHHHHVRRLVLELEAELVLERTLQQGVVKLHGDGGMPDEGTS